MTPQVALQINHVLVTAWLVQGRLQPPPVPNVTWFTQQEAVQASVMVRDEQLGRVKHANGSVTLNAFVDPSIVPSLYAWALAGWADGDTRNRIHD